MDKPDFRTPTSAKPKQDYADNNSPKPSKTKTKIKLIPFAFGFFILTVLSAIGYFTYMYFWGNKVHEVSPSTNSFPFNTWINSISYSFKKYIPLLLYLLPAIIALLFSIGNFNLINDLTEKFELWVRTNHQNSLQSDNKFVRFAIRPFLIVMVRFSDWTDSFQNRGVKNGVRVGLFLYLIVLWLSLLIYGAMIALSLGAIFVMLYIVWILVKQFSPETAATFEKIYGAGKKGWEFGKQHKVRNNK